MIDEDPVPPRATFVRVQSDDGSVTIQLAATFEIDNMKLMHTLTDYANFLLQLRDVPVEEQ